MMKKLLVLMMVLGMASMASAALQLSINGDKQATDATIDMVPSGELILDVWTDAQISAGVGEWPGWALMCNTAQATISGGVSMFTAEAGLVIIDDIVTNYGMPAPVGHNGVGGMILITGSIPNVPALATIFDLINLPCEGPGDVVVTLYGTNDYVELIYQDSVVIHQIPEPITMALLGLGGLFLRRRK
jgi:hypothetical protein